MSLPYHIGNGWFGGLLPTTAFAIVAQTGNMYNGLWYPIIIAAVTFVVGMLFVRETKDVDIYARTDRSTLTCGNCCWPSSCSLPCHLRAEQGR